MSQKDKQTKSEKLTEKLSRFDRLPDEALVSIEVLCALRDRSRASIWRDVKSGNCPAPVKIGTRCSRWRVGDLRNATKSLSDKASTIGNRKLSNTPDSSDATGTEAFYG